MNKLQRRRIDPDPVAVATLVVGTIAAVAQVGTWVSAEAREWQTRRRRRSAASIIRNLIELESRLHQVKNSFESILEKAGNTIDGAKFRYGEAKVLLDPAEFSFVNREVDRLITAIRHTHHEAGRVILGLSESNLELQEDTTKDLLDLRRSCNKVMWETESFADARCQITQLIEESVKICHKVRAYLDTMNE